MLSVPAILCVCAWLAAMPGPIENEIYYTSAMALIAGGAGIAARVSYRVGDRKVNGVQDAIARSRALVLPWEDSGNGGLPASGEMTEESSLLRREEELKDGIRQIRLALAGKEIAVTASFGVACAPHHGKGVDELLKHADEALYLSKQRGRDRVTVYPG